MEVKKMHKILKILLKENSQYFTARKQKIILQFIECIGQSEITDALIQAEKENQ